MASFETREAIMEKQYTQFGNSGDSPVMGNQITHFETREMVMEHDMADLETRERSWQIIWPILKPGKRYLEIV